MKSLETQLSPVTLVSQPPSDPFHPNLLRTGKRSGNVHNILRTHHKQCKSREPGSFKLRDTPCVPIEGSVQEQGTRGPQSLLRTYRIRNHVNIGGSSPPCSRILVPQCPPSTPNLLPPPRQALTSKTLGPALRQQPRQANSCSAP